MKLNLLTVSIVASSAVTTYPNVLIFFKLCLYVLLGIAIWRAITRNIKKRTIKEQLSDSLGQIILAIATAFILKKYIDLENDFEFLLAGFLSGLFSYGLLLLYRWLSSPIFLEHVKNKIKSKLK